MKTKLVSAISILVFGILTFGLFVSPGAAQGLATEQTPAPWKQTLAPVRETLSALPTQDGTVLENLLIREKLALGNQQTRLEMSHTVAVSTQTFIDNQKNAGKNVSTLESALSTFTQAISQAEVDHATANNLLAAPAGFDASGQVIDRNVALQTLRSAGRSLRQAHLTLTQATLDLRLAVQIYRAQ